MNDDKKKLVLYGIAGGLFGLAMLLDAFKPGGDYVAKATQFIMLASGTALGTVLFNKPGQPK
jgi:hypothetical protein